MPARRPARLKPFLLARGRQAGFEDPVLEVEKKLVEHSQTAETVKELLTKAKGLTSPELHSALLDAVQQVESETGGSVLLDGSSAGYKKFVEKVKVRRGNLSMRAEHRSRTRHEEGCALSLHALITASDTDAQAVATAHKLPWKLLLDAKKGSADPVRSACARARDGSAAADTAPAWRLVPRARCCRGP